VALDARPGDPPRSAEPGVGGQRVRERLGETLGPNRIEAILPPEAEDPERAGGPVDPGFDPPNEAIAPQQRQDVVAPAATRGRNVDLPDVVEVEE
jgi:hypothetical protein